MERIDKNYKVLLNIGGYIPPFCGILWRQPRSKWPGWGIWKGGALPLSSPIHAIFWAVNLWRFRFHIPSKRGIRLIREAIADGSNV